MTTPTLTRYLPAPGAAMEAEGLSDMLLDGFMAYVQELGLELYPAQEEAILELFGGSSVVLATPTGSGKSLVALAVAFEALAKGRRSFYTAPIKALVTEKFFDLCRALGPENVGLMTGDATVNRDSPIICCTAEILSNLALREGVNADVDRVVMDEFHYYSDRDRGVAWQVPLLILERARFLLMSATLGDTARIEEAVVELTGAPCVTVRSEERPVPLDYEYRMTPMHETLRELLEQGRAPIYVVHFTQRAATDRAQDLMSVDYLTKDEKRAIKDELHGARWPTPFGKELLRYLQHGVGVHHAGLLPRYRRVVEKLAQKGMLRIICGTDTLGVGVNVPIRTVLFTQLCKFDGEKVGVLSIRDFQQIAGRAGRRGFDALGSVVAQAPEHVIENESMRQKAVGDAKKQRKMKAKKPPDKGYVHFDEATFDKLRSSAPEALIPRFRVTHGMLLDVLARPDEDGCKAMKSLLRKSHLSRKQMFSEGRRAISMLRALLDADVMRRSEDGFVVAGDLQNDFSLNQSLSLYAVEAIESLDPESKTYALDVVSVMEAILENPGVVLLKQVDLAKTRAINAMKAEGVEYDERMKELEKIDRPKPLAEFLYLTFDEFREHHPWLEGENVRPKSIARDIWEKGMSFNDCIKEYGLSRAEGVLLRYLSQAVKALVQNVPEDAKTDELYEITESLAATVRAVDASLLDEWERLSDPEKLAAEVEVEEEEPDITRDKKAFTAMVRNASFRLVRTLGMRRFEEAAEQLALSDEAWDAERLAAAMATFFEAHGELRMDAEARAPKNLLITEGADAWMLTQILLDDQDDRDFRFEARVDLALARSEGRPRLELIALGDAAP